MSTHQDWKQWFDECAIDLCDEATQTALRDFVTPRLIAKLQRIDPDLSPPLKKEAFHLLEVDSLLPKEFGDGKRYKDWLKTQGQRLGGDPLVAIQKGVNLRIRDIAVKLAATEGHARDSKHFDGWVSLEGKLPGYPDLSYSDLLPDVCRVEDEVLVHECRQLAVDIAAEIFFRLTEIEKALAFCFGSGIPLSDPATTEAFAKGKSALYKQWNSVTASISRKVETDLAGEDERTKALIGRLALEATEGIAIKEAEEESKNNPESLLCRLLTIVNQADAGDSPDSGE